MDATYSRSIGAAMAPDALSCLESAVVVAVGASFSPRLPRGPGHGDRPSEAARPSGLSSCARWPRRGLRGVKLVTPIDHKGPEGRRDPLSSAPLGTMPRALRPQHLAHAASRAGASSPPIRRPRSAFAQEDADLRRRSSGRQVADQPRPKVPKLAALMDEAEDVLAYMSFPKEHRQKLHSTNPIAAPCRGQAPRPTSSASFTNEDATGDGSSRAILLEQNDEWAFSRRFDAGIHRSAGNDGVPITLPTVAALIVPAFYPPTAAAQRYFHSHQGRRQDRQSTAP